MVVWYYIVREVLNTILDGFVLKDLKENLYLHLEIVNFGYFIRIYANYSIFENVGIADLEDTKIV